MILASLLDNAASHLQQRQSAAAEAVSTLTQLRVGQVLAARVVEISTLTEAERDAALAKLRNEVARSVADASNQTLDAKAQLESWRRQPLLHLVELRAGARQLYVLSPEAPSLQQAVKLWVRPDGNLQLLSPLPTAAPLSSPTATSDPLQSLSQVQMQLLADSLRTALPQQGSIKDLLVHIDQLTKPLSGQSLAKLEQPIPASIRQALAAIEQRSATPEQISTPNGLKTALQASGTRLEATLASLAAHAKDKLTNQPGVQPSSTAVTNAKALTGQVPGQGEQAAPQLAESDLKAALLHALHTIQSQARSAAAATNPAPTRDNLVANVFGLTRNTGSETKAKPASESRNGASLQSLQQQLVSALAKLQTLQLQSLTQRSSESAQPGLTAHYELPVRLPEGYGNVQLHIQEYRREASDGDKSKDEKRTPTEKASLWEVFMEFDLGGAEHLTSQVKLLGDSVSASFWANSKALCQTAERQLSELRQELETNGLKVKDVKCIAGPAPRHDLKLNYNLVDVRT